MIFKKRLQATTLAVSLMTAASAYSEIFVNPIGQNAAGGWTWSALFSPSSEVEYDVQVADFELERTYAAFTGIYGLSSSIDLYGSFVPVFDIDNGNFEGDGFTFAGGVRHGLNILGFDLGTYAQFSFVSEEYELNGNATSDVNGYELIAGAMFKFPLARTTTAYAGPELVLLSEFDVENSSEEWERDNGLGIRGGVNHNLGSFTLFADLIILSEETLTFGVETRL